MGNIERQMGYEAYPPADSPFPHPGARGHGNRQQQMGAHIVLPPPQVAPQGQEQGARQLGRLPSVAHSVSNFWGRDVRVVSEG